jgi:hypothetical protein
VRLDRLALPVLAAQVLLAQEDEMEIRVIKEIAVTRETKEIAAPLVRKEIVDPEETKEILVTREIVAPLVLAAPLVLVAPKVIREPKETVDPKVIRVITEIQAALGNSIMPCREFCFRKLESLDLPESTFLMNLGLLIPERILPSLSSTPRSAELCTLTLLITLLLS